MKKRSSSLLRKSKSEGDHLLRRENEQKSDEVMISRRKEKVAGHMCGESDRPKKKFFLISISPVCVDG